MASDAVSTDRVSKVVGYKIEKGDFRESSPNLPQRIAVIGEANEANQADLDLTPKQITSAQKAGQLYGYGSPIYHILRILKPISGDGVGGIPIIVYPQAKAVGAAAKIYEISPVGTATANGTHTLKIAGRTGLDGVFYDINIETGDTAAEITAKIEDAINNVLGCPFSATSTDYEATLTSKWRGLTAEDLAVEVDTNDNDLGITYTVDSTQAGSGTPSIADALELFANDWNTIVINSYGTHAGTMTALEDFNGVPDPDAPTGRYASILMKPFIALTGSTAEDPSSITDADAKKDQVTIAICPAPLSAGLPMEAAANMGVLYARQAQDNPHLDVSGKTYPDMPTPTAIGTMAEYDSRDEIVKKGCSTVDLTAGKYVVQDFVTTYHPVGENPPQFRYVRNLNIDFIIRYGYYLLEQLYVVDHVIADNDDLVSASNVLKPKTWKGQLYGYAEDLGDRALIVDVDFMQNSITTGLSTSNPDRLETFFRYKRSGLARISSTTAEAGFNFGTLN
jgi:phage tail sheath gpL-like